MKGVNVYERLWKQESTIRRLISDGYRDPEQVSRILQEMIIDDRKGPMVEVDETAVFCLVVDYTRPLKKGIMAGRYDYVNRNVTEGNFPSGRTEKGKRKKKVAFSFFHPDKEVESDEALEQIERDGCRPATLKELLSFGQAKPELQRQFPIIALGSIWVSPDGGRSVVGLWGDSKERRLTISYFVRRWSRRHRFLGILK